MSKNITRRTFLKGTAVAAAASAAPNVSFFRPNLRSAYAAKSSYTMVFISFAADVVASAWSQGIKEVLDTQQVIQYQLENGQSKVDVQLSLMDTAITQGVDAIFLQPVDSV